MSFYCWNSTVAACDRSLFVLSGHSPTTAKSSGTRRRFLLLWKVKGNLEPRPQIDLSKWWLRVEEVKQNRSVIASLGTAMDLSAIRVIRKEDKEGEESVPRLFFVPGGEVLTQGGLIPSPHWRFHSSQTLCPAANPDVFPPPPQIKASLHLASFTRLCPTASGRQAA